MGPANNLASPISVIISSPLRICVICGYTTPLQHIDNIEDRKFGGKDFFS